MQILVEKAQFKPVFGLRSENALLGNLYADQNAGRKKTIPPTWQHFYTQRHLWQLTKITTWNITSYSFVAFLIFPLHVVSETVWLPSTLACVPAYLGSEIFWNVACWVGLPM